MPVKLKIRKGDRVVVISGKDKGKSGEVLRVIPKDMRAIVQGVNLARRHQRQTDRSMVGGTPGPALHHREQAGRGRQHRDRGRRDVRS